MSEKMKEVIMVPTDFSEVCYNAVEHAVEIAKFLKFKVIVLHIVNKDTEELIRKEGLSKGGVAGMLSEIEARIKQSHGFNIETRAEEGSIFNTIGKVSKEIGAKLIVLGTHGKSGMQHITGSYAKQVIVTSEAPVIVIQKGAKFEDGYKDIIFPVSTTAEVRQKVKWAVMIAKTFKSKIHIYQLLESSLVAQRKMNVIISQIMGVFDENKISFVHVLAKKGNFAKQLMSYAKGNGADLIAIMTTPDSVNFVISPYDEKMIFNEFRIPVMCVNPTSVVTLHWFGG